MVLLKSALIILFSNCRDEQRPHCVCSFREVSDRWWRDELNHDVYCWNGDPTQTKRLTQHSFYAIAINRAAELPLPYDQSETRTGFVVRGRIHAETTLAHLHRASRQDAIELPFAREAVFTREEEVRRDRITQRGACGPLPYAR
jgi:hypothetical protein